MRYLFAQLLSLITISVFSQTGVIQGNIIDSEKKGVENIEVQLQPTGTITFTDSAGFFEFTDLAAGEYVVRYGQNRGVSVVVNLSESETKILSGLFYTTQDQSETETDLSENIFNDLDVLETADESSSVSSLLTASRDVFLNKAGFQFGSDVFFNVRGYDTRYTDFMINGIRFDNPETGWQPFNLVGGMNDVLRYRDEVTIGANSLDNGLGEVGGATNFDLRPSEYGYGGRLTYSNLNRFYDHRMMASFHSGEQANGWSYVVSASKRWADEGYVDGTYYDAYAGYAAVEKKVSDNYSVMASAFASPRRRATNSIHRQEAYDIVGSNFYNADWGWQNGEKRSARLRNNINPVFMLSNYISVSPKTELQVTGSYLTGNNANTRIERQNAANPDPDYYRNMPSITQPSPFVLIPESRQLNWDAFYRANRIPDVDTLHTEVYNFPGNNANYILEENIREDNEFQATAQFITNLNNKVSLNYGANFKNYNGNFYREAKDLLGADYYLDVDVFNRNTPNNADASDPRVYQGGRFGNDYDLNKREYDAYIQGNFTFDKIDAFVAGSYGRADYWREGNIRFGAAPNNSLGESEVAEFTTFGAKAGATYKFDGRNYLSVNGMFYQKPPVLTTVWEAPNARNSLHPLAEEEQIYSGEANYVYQSPNLKVRLTGYATRFENQAESLLAFSDTGARTEVPDDESNFGYFYTHGIDKLHIGSELGALYKINPEFELSGAAAIGRYTIMSRPVATGYAIINENPILPPSTSFLLNFYEDNTPQTALNLGLTWRAPKRIIVNLDGNYYNNAYAGPSALRRTTVVAQQFEPIEGLTEQESRAFWTRQERLPDAYRMNLSLYKNFRISYEKSISINARIDNLFNDQNYPTLAFEDTRVQDTNGNGEINPNDFPTRYRYSFGRTYFVNIAYKFR